jgi:hypothetical protein
MENTGLIRIISGVLFVVVLIVLVQRHRSSAR